MKTAIIGDLHFGVRAASSELHEYMGMFFADLFAYVDEHRIKNLILTGDVFDSRKTINILVIEMFKDMFLSETIKRDLSVFSVVGNHDIYYRETVAVNTLKTLLRDHQVLHPGQFTIIDEAKDVNIGGTTFFMVPWVCKDNHEAVAKAIKKSKAKYCVGHFEFDGFEMQRGQVMKTAHSHKAYSKFDTVFSGHYHSKSQRDNVLYVGTPYELTWMDYGDEKGFWVFDDGDVTMVSNPHTLHSKIYYSDGFAPDKNDVHKKYVQLFIEQRIPKKELDSYLNVVHSMGPYDVKVKETYNDSLSESTIVHTDMKDTTDMISEYVNDSDLTLDKQRMIGIMHTLYRQAMLA